MPSKLLNLATNNVRQALESFEFALQCEDENLARRLKTRAETIPGLIGEYFSQYDDGLITKEELMENITKVALS